MKIFRVNIFIFIFMWHRKTRRKSPALGYARECDSLGADSLCSRRRIKSQRRTTNIVSRDQQSDDKYLYEKVDDLYFSLCDREAVLQVSATATHDGMLWQMCFIIIHFFLCVRILFAFVISLIASSIYFWPHSDRVTISILDSQHFHERGV